MKPELLAPVGSMEALYAAVEAGCDAVYLSGKKYGARSFANNFSDDELVSAIEYCHLYGVLVYVTVNTIIYEDEVDDFIKYIDFIHSNNVDAVIMQDIGMVDLVRKLYPNLEVHISTQMHVHNLEGVKFFEKMGLKRVVLARETSIDLIREIKRNSDVDLEVFVHGALCISYSGQCLMSSLIGGRSGNRGACAQSCRLPYDLISEGKRVNRDKYLISTRDLMTLNHVGELIEAGVDSFKIEGRMKRPEYVYLIVSLYRKAIDSYFEKGVVSISDDDILSMKKIFNRGFTDGFLFNEKFIVNQKRPNHMGISIGRVVNYKNGFVFVKLSSDLNVHDGVRIVGTSDIGFNIDKMFIDMKSVSCAKDEDVVSFKCDKVKVGSEVLKTTDFLQLSEINDKISSKSMKVLITGLIKLISGNDIYLELSDGVNRVSVSEFNVSPAINRSISRDDVLSHIDRLGGTVFKFSNLDIVMDDNIFVPISVLNSIRRKAIDLLTSRRLYSTNYKKGVYSISVPNFSSSSLKSCLISDASLYSKDYDSVYVDDYDSFKNLSFDNVFYKVPRVNYKYRDFDSRVLVGEVGSLYRYKNVDTDFSFNVVNSYSVAFLHSIGVNKVTLSYEMELYQVKNLIDAYHSRYNSHPNLEVIVHSREEVMVSKFNLLDYYGVSSGSLKDRFGNLYPIKVRDGLMYIYNYKFRNLDSSMYYDIGVNSVRFDL